MPLCINFLMLDLINFEETKFDYPNSCENTCCREYDINTN